MTDSLTIRLDLSSLSDSSRERIGQYVAQRHVMRRRVGKRNEYFRPKKFASPLSDASLTLDFMQRDDNPESLPNAVVADLNLPSALFGQNYTHEANVWAAATAGVKLVKIVLAHLGLSAGELATLRAEHVTLESVTLTFLYQLASKAEAELRLTALGASLRAMLPNKIDERHSTNRTLYFSFPGFNICIYNKTNEKTISWPIGAPAEVIRAQGERLVRLEVKLWQSFIAERNLHDIEAWKGARWEGLYKTLFDATVVKAFRLDEALRQKRPRPHKIEHLTPVQKEIVKLCLAGGDPQRHSAVSASVRPADAFSRHRLTILRLLEMDIGITWDRHKAMRHYELRQFLKFPPPYKIVGQLAPWSFCKTSWSALIERLDAAVAQANNKQLPGTTGRVIGTCATVLTTCLQMCPVPRT